jgi:LPPG:FO 2-phospho-L-lactate transferase
MITVLAGGTGSIKLIRGLASQHCDLKVISNVGDNIWLYGLYICPDIDTVIYGLAGMLDPIKGWGIRNDSFQCLRQMEMLGEQTWFKIGDRDLATHLLRTIMLKNGKRLSYITEWIRKMYSVSAGVIPATDDPIQTRILTERGEMHIQEFWVKHRAEPTVIDIRYRGTERARINPNVVRAIKQSKLIVIPPANPVSSIGPILAIRGLKKVLVEQRNKIVGVSPLIGNMAISGPAVKYMEAMKLPTTPFGIAQNYSDFLTKFVISKDDLDSSRMIEGIGIKVYETDILMKSSDDENRLASYLLTQT